MTSIFELPSFNPETMSDEEREQFEVLPVGESFHSLRTTFSVKCKFCGKLLHKATNGPQYRMEQHKEFEQCLHVSAAEQSKPS